MGSRQAPQRTATQKADIALLSSAHDVADARLHRLCRALCASGLSVRLDAVGDVRHAPESLATMRGRPRAGGARRAVRALVLVAGAKEPVLLVVDPDVAIFALPLARLRRQQLVVDLHEDYVAALQDRAWARGPLRTLAGVVARAAVRAAQRADLTVVADSHVPPLRARHRLVVPNRPTLQEFPDRVRPDPHPRAVYIGDVRESRGLQWMVEAVAEAPPWHLDIIGSVAPSARGWIEHRRADPELGERIRVHGRKPPAEAWRVAEGAWVGFALLYDTPAFRSAMPTKLYEYLAAGLAVITSPLPRMVELVASSGAGMTVRTVEEASEALRMLGQQPARLEAFRVAARSWAESHLVAEDGFQVLAHRIAELIDKEANSHDRTHPAWRRRRRAR